MHARVTCLFFICWTLMSGTPLRGEPSTCFEWHGIKFMSIPAGNFTMGANSVDGKDLGYKDERPKRDLELSTFCMMRGHLTETQVAELRKIYELGRAPEFGPASAMTWNEAQKLAGKLSADTGKTIRLPTEAEWEYAARGGLNGKEFPWGNIDETYNGKSVRDIVLSGRLACQFFAVEKMLVDKAIKKCIPQKSDPDEQRYQIFGDMGCVRQQLRVRVPTQVENDYGLVDIVNNDWEWTSSLYMRYPYLASDGRENPNVPREHYRAIRGGSYDTERCLGYTSLRGRGGVNRRNEEDTDSTYNVRFVLER